MTDSYSDIEIYRTAEEEGIIEFGKGVVKFDINGMLKNKWYSFVYKAQQFVVRLGLNGVLEVVDIQ